MAENVLLIEAVEKHFGAVEGVPADHALEILTDNGCAYIAHETRNIARSLGLRPVNTPVCSLQSNGMAESFVNTFRRDYLARMDLGDAQSVLAQLPAAFKHFNEVHPHSCIDPALSAQIRLLKHKPQRGSSCPAPGGGAGSCKSGSSRQSHGWRVAASRTGDGARIDP